MKLDIFNRQQLLDRLHDCQNGEASCIKVMKEIEAAVEREIAEFEELFKEAGTEKKRGGAMTDFTKTITKGTINGRKALIDRPMGK